MASTYTPKLNLAKPANGDIDWHIPINENWDKIDTELDKALKISGTTIDADKDWQGHDITNVGAIDTLTGNVGARSQFVDVPGDVLRQTFTPNIALNYNDPPATLATFTIPANYSADHDSNFRIGVWKTTSYFTFSTSITVYRNGTQIGSLEMGYWQSAGNVDTTGGCAAGDVITVKGKYNGDERFWPVVQTVEVKSARKADIPAYKVFAETGAW
jgi:hypothetical protein